MNSLHLPVLGDTLVLGGDEGEGVPKPQLRDKNGNLLYDKNHKALYPKSNG